LRASVMVSSTTRSVVRIASESRRPSKVLKTSTARVVTIGFGEQGEEEARVGEAHSPP
jgi:hypothetical protein